MLNVLSAHQRWNLFNQRHSPNPIHSWVEHVYFGFLGWNVKAYASKWKQKRRTGEILLWNWSRQILVVSSNGLTLLVTYHFKFICGTLLSFLYYCLPVASKLHPSHSANFYLKTNLFTTWWGNHSIRKLIFESCAFWSQFYATLNQSPSQS